MLVLSRKKQQRIKIDGGIEVVVVDIRNDSVQLGIVAPKEVQIVRDDAKVTHKGIK